MGARPPNHHRARAVRRCRPARSFLAWVQETFADEDMAEAAGVLRRACEISFGRGVDLDAVGRASELGEMVVGSCHSFQPGTIDQAVRVKGTTLDFSVASPEL